MKVSIWIFIPVIVYAIIVSFFLFYKNPLPFPDRGHRCFSVTSEKAAQTVVKILDNYAGLSERFTFDAGPTHQTLLWDNTTVIIRMDEEFRKRGDFSLNALSVPVSDPIWSAEQAVKVLKQNGFSARLVPFKTPDGANDKMVIVECDAFDGWALIFRRHILCMGMPKTRKMN